MHRVLMILALVAVSAGAGFYVGSSNKSGRIKWLEEELAENRAQYADSSRAQLQRSLEAAELSERVEKYERELAEGQSSSCPSDPAYDRILRGVLETGGEPALGGGP